MRALFFGSPDFAVPCLDALSEVAEVCAVVCQPDKKAGRGMKDHAPEVKTRALELGLPVLQPTKIRTGDFQQTLASLGADIGVVVAYGRILPESILATPRRGCVNVHASLLPRWRGASPIQHSLLYGDSETGVTLMQMDAGLDTGGMIALKRFSLDRDIDSPTLSHRLSALGAELVRDELKRYVDGLLPVTPQPVEGVTYAKLLEKSDALLDFGKPARVLHDQVRGLRPWPGTETSFRGETLKVHDAAEASESGTPGTILRIDDTGILVACGEGALLLREVQEAGRKRMAAAVFANGRKLQVGELLSGASQPE